MAELAELLFRIKEIYRNLQWNRDGTGRNLMNAGSAPVPFAVPSQTIESKDKFR
jgi:hypothetical protein